ncbi:MAG TPA: preprotein translocase subunit TatB, partial [Accumulibacter sp.]|nr:preprotein translocase subunit TatB [Accumulibacter sp.]
FVGIGFVGLDFSPDPWLFAWAVLGVAAIGLLNLSVSFALALTVALRSRQVPDGEWWPLARAVFGYFLRHPRGFFLPPKKGD